MGRRVGARSSGRSGVGAICKMNIGYRRDDRTHGFRELLRNLIVCRWGMGREVGRRVGRKV